MFFSAEMMESVREDLWFNIFPFPQLRWWVMTCFEMIRDVARTQPLFKKKTTVNHITRTYNISTSHNPKPWKPPQTQQKTASIQGSWGEFRPEVWAWWRCFCELFLAILGHEASSNCKPQPQRHQTSRFHLSSGTLLQSYRRIPQLGTLAELIWDCWGWFSSWRLMP